MDNQLQRHDPVTLAEQASTDEFDSVSGLGAGADVLVVSGSRGDQSLVDPATLEVVGTLPASQGRFTDLAFDAGDDRLLTLGADNEIRLYDLAARTQLGVGLRFNTTMPSNNRSQRGLALRPDGGQAAFDVPGGIAIWDLDPNQWVLAACELASRNLTREEWDSYIGAPAEYHATCPQFPVDT